MPLLISRRAVALLFVATLLVVTLPARAGVALGVGPSPVFGAPGVYLPTNGLFAHWNPVRGNVTLDGSNNVSAIADSSGNGRALTQTTAGLRPGWTAASTLKGVPAVVFNGAGYLDTATFSLPEPHTLLFVMKTSVGGSGAPVAYDQASSACNNRATVVPQSPAPGFVSMFPDVGGCIGTGGVSADLSLPAVPLIGYTLSAGVGTFYSNGVASPTVASCTPSFVMSSARWGAACTGTSNFVNGPWTQGLLWSRALSASEMAIVNIYAQVFWGASNTDDPSPPSSWTPAAPMAGVSLYAWIDPASALIDGSGNIQSIPDQSGNGHALTQTTAGNRPPLSTLTSHSGTVAPGGLPAIYCNGAGYLDTGALALAEPYTILLQTGQAPYTEFATLFDTTGDLTSRNVLGNYTSASTQFWYPTFGQLNNLLTPTLDLSTLMPQTIIMTVVSGTATIYANGTSIGSLTCANPFTLTSQRYGAAWNGTSAWTGPLSQIVMWEGALSGAQLAQANAWAQAKFGTLPDIVIPVGNSLSNAAYDVTYTGTNPGNPQTGIGVNQSAAWIYQITSQAGWPVGWTPAFNGNIDANAGRYTADMITYLGQPAHGLSVASSLRRNQIAVVFMAATNDVATSGATAAVANLDTINADLFAAGYTVLFVTEMPWLGWSESQRSIVNTHILATFPNVVDLGSDATLQAGLSLSGGTWGGTYDGTLRLASGQAVGHLTAAGEAYVASKLAPIIAGFKM